MQAEGLSGEDVNPALEGFLMDRLKSHWEHGLPGYMAVTICLLWQLFSGMLLGTQSSSPGLKDWELVSTWHPPISAFCGKLTAREGRKKAFGSSVVVSED